MLAAACAGVPQQLAELCTLLSPELVHVSLASQPALLDVQTAVPAAALRWLQAQLGLTPAAALLLAGRTAPQLLLTAPEQLADAYVQLRYLLRELLGWQRQAAHTLMCNAPGLLLAPPAAPATAWAQAMAAARRRRSWLTQLSAPPAPLVADVLTACRRQLLQLVCAAETGTLPRAGLRDVLRMEYADYVAACPEYRMWRAAAPGRWLLLPRHELHPELRERGGAGSGNESQLLPVTSALSQPQGNVLAADERGLPVLVCLGEHDRLTL